MAGLLCLVVLNLANDAAAEVYPLNYRPFGKLGIQVSALGFGCMRLPLTADRTQVDEPEAIRLLHYAFERGVNYVDTAYGYHGGQSERVLGRALAQGYRERVWLATKLPCGLVTQRADFDRIFAEQLAKLQTDRIDFYLLHGLRRARWEFVRDLGVVEWLESLRQAGRVRYLGFSFHDSPAVLRQIVDHFDGWDFCQVQYNYMDEETPTQAGTAGVCYAAARGLGVVVMEPLLGGSLATPAPGVQALWDQAARRRSAAEWALQWVWRHPEVSLALSGMSSLEQVVENVAIASRPGLGVLSADELRLVGAVRDRYVELRPIPCTQCGYCLPCPSGVEIPSNLALLNRAAMYGRLAEARQRYARMDAAQRADVCAECGECESKCPQSIAIIPWLAQVQRVLGEGADLDPAWRPQA